MENFYPNFKFSKSRQNNFKLFCLSMLLVFGISINIQAQNNALQFNGSSQYVTADGVSAGWAAKQSLSMETWVYPTASTGQRFILNFHGVSPTNNNLILFGTNNGFLQLSQAGPEATGSALPLNQWSHIALTIDALNNATVYLNGQVDITAIIANRPILDGKFTIGQDWDVTDATDFFSGQIDEVRVWNTMRTQDEIKATMFKELTGTETGLKAYYNFNDGSGASLTDNSGNSNTGTLVNLPTWKTSGAFAGSRNALNFDGIDDYVTVPSNLKLKIYDDLTIETWAKYDNLGLGTKNQLIIQGGIGESSGENEANNIIYSLGIKNNLHLECFMERNVGSNIYEVGTNTPVTSSQPAQITPNTWHHFALVRVGSTRKITFYVDGMQLGSIKSYTATPTGSTTSPLFIGSETTHADGTAVFPFDGQMDEVRIWNIVRTASEIRETMMKTLLGNESGLVAYYRFDQTTGPTLKDITRNGNDGTLTHMDETEWTVSNTFNTWLGVESSDWNNANNWSDGVPASTDNVGIYKTSLGKEATITGSPVLNNLMISSTSAPTLSSGLTVNGNLITNKAVNLNSQTITLGPTAYLLEKAGSELFGTSGDITTTRVINNISGLNVANMGAVISTTANMGSTIITRGHTVQTTGVNSSIARYFDIKPDGTKTGLNASLTFNYADSELNGLTESSLKLFKDGGSSWINEGGSVDATANTLLLTGINTFGKFTAAFDIAAPTVSSVSSTTTDGAYKIGDEINITITFNEAVTVNTTGGTPQLTLETGITDAVVNYTSGSGTSTLIFNYIIAEGQNSSTLDYTSATALSLNGGTIKDGVGNNAVLTLASPGLAGSLSSSKALVVDGTIPTINNLSSSIANGSYKIGDVIPISVNFSESVTVTGTPQITLETGNSDAVVNYTSGSGTSKLAFNYTILEGQNSPDLDYTLSTALALNGGTIQDSVGNNAVLTLASPGATGSLSNNQAIVVDGTKPTITITAEEVNDGTASNNTILNLIFTISEITTNFIESDISMANGTLGTLSGTGKLYYATFTPAADGTTTINVSAGKFTDAVGNDNTVANEFNWTFDSTNPAITITAAEVSDGATSNDGTLNLTFNISENITNFVKGDIIVANGTLGALSGTGKLYYATFTPAADGPTTITVAAGSFTDAVGNDNSVANEFNWTFDSTNPAITITAAEVSDGATSNDGTLNLTFNISENITNFAKGDIIVANGTLGALSGTGKLYYATFTPAADGPTTITVAAGSFTDAAGNDNTVADEFNWTFDSTNPAITITAAEVADGATSNDGKLNLTFTISENTTNFADSDIEVTNGTLGTLSGTGKLYYATFSPAADGATTINVAAAKFTDAVGNNNTVADEFNWIFDSTKPAIIITAAEVADGATSNDGTLSLIFTISEITTNFVKNDIIVTNGTLSALFGTGNLYYATFTPAADGATTINVSAAKFTDAVGNDNTEANEFNWTFDNTKPSGYIVAIDQTVINDANKTAASFTFESAEIGTTYNYSISDGTNNITGTGTIATVTDQISDIDLSSLNEGLLTLEFALTDASGNTGNITTDSKIKDTVAPSAEVTYSPSGIFKVGDEITFSATFTELLKDGLLPQISLSGGNTLAAVNMNKTAEKVYTYHYTLTAGTTAVSVTLDTATDLAGNPISEIPTAGSSFSFNTLPTAENATIDLNEDEIHVMLLSDFGYLDANDDPLSKIIITAINGKGFFFLDANDDKEYTESEKINLNDEISVDRISNVLFRPLSDESGENYMNFSFLVNDGNMNSTSSYLIDFNVYPVNDTPTAKYITPLFYDEDSPTRTLDLRPYFLDKETGSQFLAYILLNNTNPDLFKELIINKYDLSITFEPHASGIAEITLQVSDPEGSSTYKTLTINLKEINDIPYMISQIPDVVIQKGQMDYEMDLATFFGDREQASSSLTYLISTLSNPDIFETINIEGSILKLRVYENINGASDISLLVKDSEGNNITCSFNIEIINDLNDLLTSAPPVITEYEDVAFSLNTMDLSAYFEKNLNLSDTSFHLVFENGNDIRIKERSGNSTQFETNENWFGQETLKLTILYQSMVTTTDVTINIESVNDIPVFISEDFTFDGKSQDTTLVKLWDFVKDIEEESSLLHYEFTSENNNLNMVLDSITGQLSLSTKESYLGTSKFKIKVTDNSDASVEKEFSFLSDYHTGNQNLISTTQQIRLDQNIPNPFNQKTTIGFNLPEESLVNLKIFSKSGALIMKLMDQVQLQKGEQKVALSGENLSPGVYLYRLDAVQKNNGKRSNITRKMVVFR